MRLSTTYIILFIIVCLLVIAPNTLSQTSLKQYAVQKTLQWQTERAHAESIAIRQHMPIRVEREDGTIIELQRIQNGIPIYYKTDNLNAAKTVSTNKVWPSGGYGYSLTGDSIVLGEWDAGRARPTHQEFGSRIIFNQSGDADHSTHVAGTMIAAGVRADAKGMSYHGLLKSYDWNNVEAEMATEAAAGLRVSNHSWGLITGWYWSGSNWYWFGDITISQWEDYKFGFYDYQSVDWDNIAQNAPYFLIVKSAGNDRWEGPLGQVQHYVNIDGTWTLVTAARNLDGNTYGYDCLSGAGVSKNVLTVGAVNKITTGYTGPSSVVMSSFSSWGPTDDGRIKPDIVADGVNLVSSVASADNAYATYSGTSMATPNVTGSVGLLLQHQKNLHGNTPLRSSTLKGIIIHTADEAGPNPGPDYMFGWGLLNTLKAAQIMTLDSAEGSGSHIREFLLHQGDTATFQIDCAGTSPLKATICWTELPGTRPPDMLNPPNLMLKNDIDLRIINNRTHKVHYPWILNPATPSAAATTGDNFRDNVEQVYIQSPERTVYTVRVTHKGTLVGGSQYVSLMISGNVPRIGAYTLITPSSASYQTIPGGFIQDSIKIKNNGDTGLVYNTHVPDSLTYWLSVAEISGTIAQYDSGFIHYSVNAGLLKQWSTYNGSFQLQANDLLNPTINFPITVTTLGPTIAASPLHIISDVDFGDVGTDSIKIRNDGYIPLNFSVSGSTGSLPAWLTLSGEVGTLAPHESLYVKLAFNEVSQPIGDYYTSLKITSNDSVRGTKYANADLHIGTRRTVSADVTDFWNIISLPVIPLDGRKTELYPTAKSAAYAYNGIYNTKDTLQAGEGYWMRFDVSQSIPIEGYVFRIDTLNLRAGWNLIGTISSPIAVSDIVSDPPNNIGAPFYSYYRGYFTVDSLYPGRGYWSKLDQPGQLILGGIFPPLAKTSASKILSNFNTLTISDGENNHQTLYFGSSDLTAAKATFFALPPRAPEGSFDARFSSGRMLELITPNSTQKHDYPITIQTAKSPITIHWNIKPEDVKKYVILDESGRTYPLNQNGSITLDAQPSAIRTLKLSYEAPKIPKEFALQQNYPNPFNPSTKISYELPSAGFASIKIYNLLGNEVATLVEGNQEAGYHTAEFDATNLASGIYIYKMKTEKFSAVKKMILMR